MKMNLITVFIFVLAVEHLYIYIYILDKQSIYLERK